MPSTQPEPTEVEIKNAERVVRVAWDDGAESRFAFTYLRGNCPCAVCQGHSTTRTFVTVAAPVVAKVEEVGSYALNIVWRDSEGAALHATGIYSYDFLRLLDAEQRGAP